jgi:hypothetical protein
VRNITVAIDDQTYRNIRLWCAMRDISVSRVVRTILNGLPRLEHVRHFPLPQAPDPGSPGFSLDELPPHEIAYLLSQFWLLPPTPPYCEVKL